MSDSTLSGNPVTRRTITRKNIVIGLLSGLFLLIVFWCHGRPSAELGLLSFTPLVALAVLSLIGVDIVLAVISSIIIAMIMTSTGLPEMGAMLAKSTGSFIANRRANHYARRRGGGSGYPHRRGGSADDLYP